MASGKAVPRRAHRKVSEVDDTIQPVVNGQEIPKTTAEALRKRTLIGAPEKRIRPRHCGAASRTKACSRSSMPSWTSASRWMSHRSPESIRTARSAMARVPAKTTRRCRAGVKIRRPFVGSGPYPPLFGSMVSARGLQRRSRSPTHGRPSRCTRTSEESRSQAGASRRPAAQVGVHGDTVCEEKQPVTSKRWIPETVI